MAWLASPERLFKPGRSRLVFIFVAATAFAVTEFGRFVVRPYVRDNGIDDYGLTDTIGNWGGIVVQIFFGLAMLNPTRAQSYRLAAFFSVGYIIYEIVQPMLPRGTFDWNDVWGTVVGYVIAVLILLLVWRLVPGDEPVEAPLT